jgi:DivIVA domain-containing protein
MDSSQPARSSLEMLRTVEFRQSLKGYNVEEVDEYLEKAAVEAESLQEQTRQVNERLRQATERIAQLENELRESPSTAAPASVEGAQADESLQRTLVMAQRFVDQARRESEAEAAEVVAQAELRAQATIAQAEERARRLATDAEQDLRDEVSRLETARGQLAVDVENMSRHLELERTRLQGALTEILQWIEDNVQPARSLMALRSTPQGEGSAEEAGPARVDPVAPVAPTEAVDPPVIDLRHAAGSASSVPGGSPTVEGR